MTEITLENKIDDILKKFINNDEIDFQKELEKFTDNELNFHIRYEKYESSITYPLAKIIINLQESIYKVASLFYYNVKDIRKLTNKQKQDLELVFKISKGSSIEDIKNYKNVIKELLDMIPEKDRALCFIVLIIFVTLYLSWSKYLDTKNEGEKNNIVNNAINKMSTINEELVQIIKENEIIILNNLQDLDKKIQIQETEYTKEDLKYIKDIKINENSKKNKEEKKIETMNGYYKIIMIDNEKNSIIIENIENDNDVKTIYYVPNGDLLSKTEEIKKSVGDPNKIFKIKFEAIKKGEKTDILMLQDIYETNNK